MPLSRSLSADTLFPQVSMPNREGDTDCPAGITRGGLNPDVLKRPFAQNPTVSYTIKGHAASHAQFGQAGFFMSMPDHLKDCFFRDGLYAARQIHFPLGNLCFRPPRSTIKDSIKRCVRHSQSL